MPKIMVIGGSGLLGCSLVPYLRENGHEVLVAGRERTGNVDLEMNFSEEASVEILLTAYDPEFIVNLVALTDVDLCERDPRAAYHVNVSVVEKICSWVDKSSNRHLIQISTDHVYNSERASPENDVDLLNYYAFSKFAGELTALRSSSTVLRTNFFGKSLCEQRVSFTDWLFRKAKFDQQVHLFEDVMFSPLSLQTLVRYIELVVNRPHKGLFNLGSDHGSTKFEFGRFFGKKLGFPDEFFVPIECSKLDLVASRPSDMRMDSGRFAETFELGSMPSLEEEIISVIGDYENDCK